MIALPILFLLNTAQAVPLEDNLALTRTLHEQIVMRSVERSPAAMKPYKNVIPGTDVPYEMLPIPGGNKPFPGYTSGVDPAGLWVTK